MSMRSRARSQADNDAVVLVSRPLLSVTREGKIVWAISGDPHTLPGGRCWETLACGAESRAQCMAEHTPTDGKNRSVGASIDGTRGVLATCLIAAMPDALPAGPSASTADLLIWGPAGQGTVHLGALLPVVAGLAGTWLSRDVIHGGVTALALFRTALDADCCELFLSDLYGKEMLLSGSVGCERPNRVERVRFEPGKGFPGLGFAPGEPLTTRSLVRDPRFRRQSGGGSGQESDLSSFISVPIVAPDGHTLGCLNFAWRRRDVPVEQLAQEVMVVMPQLGNALCAAYWILRERIVRTGAAGAGKQPLVAMLRALNETAGAQAASLVVWDERNRTVRQAKSFGTDPPNCPWLASPEASPCSSRENESQFRLMALSKPEQGWPEPCRQMRFDGDAVCCIPVTGRPGRTGRVLLGFERGTPAGPLQLLVPMHVMVEQIGLQLDEPGLAPAAEVHKPSLPQLKIRCFGHFELMLGEQDLPRSAFPRRDAITLLKMLVLRAGKQVHRERLIDWLWPGAGGASGVNRLHGVVHALRGVIEPHASERRWKYLLNEGDTYSFSPADSTFVDLIRFQEYLSLARRDQRDTGFAPQVAHYLEQAVELYRGDLFEDDEAPEWCDVERIALQREFVEALASLARIYSTLGEAKRAIDVLRRALSYDPGREDLHHDLIVNLVKLGRHKEAKEQISDCMRLLRDELGVEPTAETQRLYRTIVSGT